MNNEKVYVYAFEERPAAYQWVSQQPGAWLVELPAGKAALGRWLNHTKGAIAPAPNGGEIPDRVHFSVCPWIIESAHMGRWDGDIPRPEQFTTRPGREGGYKTLIGACPWLFTQAEYAAACTAAIKQGDTEALEELSRIGRKYQFPLELGKTPTLKEILAKEKKC